MIYTTSPPVTDYKEETDYWKKLRDATEHYISRRSPRLISRTMAAFDALKTESMSAVKEVAFHGLPEDFYALRAIFWKILLRYLPIESSKWSLLLKEKKTVYFSSVEKFILEPLHIKHLKQIILKGGPSHMDSIGRLTQDNTPSTVLTKAPPIIKPTELKLGYSNQHTQSTTPSSVSPYPNHSTQITRIPINVKGISQPDPLLRSTLSVKTASSSQKPELCHQELNHIPSSLHHSFDPLYVPSFPIYQSIVDDLELSSDIDTFDQINKDVFRTRADIQLFSSPIASHSLQLKNQIEYQKAADMCRPNTHTDLLARILFVYSKLHPAVKYTQGMNELLAPLFFVIFEDSVCDDIEQKEADTFFCFSALLQLNGQYELFCRAFDKDKCGVLGRVQHFGNLLKRYDPVLFEHFERLSLDPQFFALRWILLLLTQEFCLPDVLRLWDSLLSEGDVYQTDEEQLIYFICLSILRELRRQLLEDDFSACMRILQNLPVFDPCTLISTGIIIRQKLHRMMLQSLQRHQHLSFRHQTTDTLPIIQRYNESFSMPKENQEHTALPGNELVDRMRRACAGIASLQSSTDVQEAAVTIGTASAEYAKNAVRSVHNWLNTSPLVNSALQNFSGSLMSTPQIDQMLENVSSNPSYRTGLSEGACASFDGSPHLLLKVTHPQLLDHHPNNNHCADYQQQGNFSNEFEQYMNEF